ncbi:MAG: hypothetical protein HYU64_13560 [Armatimonadetes bacterium]|nr:hypothetical protein [Armatimonadota bacterium]
MAQGSIEESRCYLILAKDIEYGDVSELSQLLEEVSKLLEAYSQAILNSDSCILSTCLIELYYCPRFCWKYWCCFPVSGSYYS